MGQRPTKRAPPPPPRNKYQALPAEEKENHCTSVDDRQQERRRRTQQHQDQNQQQQQQQRPRERERERERSYTVDVDGDDSFHHYDNHPCHQKYQSSQEEDGKYENNHRKGKQ